jgi:hypothetical protein
MQLTSGRLPQEPAGFFRGGDQMKETDHVEGRALQRFHSSTIGTFDKGQRVRVSVAHARHLTAIGVLELDPIPGPQQTKPAGPAETKEAAAKKSCGAPTDGRSIDSPSSSAPGLVRRSSFLPAGLLSQTEMASLERVLGAIERAGLSLSLR